MAEEARRALGVNHTIVGEAFKGVTVKQCACFYTSSHNLNIRTGTDFAHLFQICWHGGAGELCPANVSSASYKIPVDALAEAGGGEDNDSSLLRAWLHSPARTKDPSGWFRNGRLGPGVLKMLPQVILRGSQVRCKSQNVSGPGGLAGL